PLPAVASTQSSFSEALARDKASRRTSKHCGQQASAWARGAGWAELFYMIFMLGFLPSPGRRSTPPKTSPTRAEGQRLERRDPLRAAVAEWRRCSSVAAATGRAVLQSHAPGIAPFGSARQYFAISPAHVYQI